MVRSAAFEILQSLVFWYTLLLLCVDLSSLLAVPTFKRKRVCAVSRKTPTDTLHSPTALPIPYPPPPSSWYYAIFTPATLPICLFNPPTLRNSRLLHKTDRGETEAVAFGEPRREREGEERGEDKVSGSLRRLQQCLMCLPEGLAIFVGERKASETIATEL